MMSVLLNIAVTRTLPCMDQFYIGHNVSWVSPRNFVTLSPDNWIVGTEVFMSCLCWTPLLFGNDCMDPLFTGINKWVRHETLILVLYYIFIKFLWIRRYVCSMCSIPVYDASWVWNIANNERCVIMGHLWGLSGRRACWVTFIGQIGVHSYPLFPKLSIFM